MRSPTGATGTRGWPAARGSSPSRRSTPTRLIDLRGAELAVARNVGRRARYCGNLHDRRAVRIRAARSVDVGAAHRRMLPLVPIVVQDLERSDRRRQHLYVAAGWPDDLADRRARRRTYKLWPRDGEPREVAGDRLRHRQSRNVLHRANCCAAIHLPARTLEERFAFRRSSLTHLGRSARAADRYARPGQRGDRADGDGRDRAPVQLAFAAADGRRPARRNRRAIPDDLYLADVHGSPAYRRHLTYYFAEQIRRELSA